jgi:hypothetical protein
LLRRGHDRGRRDHHFAWDRKNGTLKRHKAKNRDVAAGQHPVEPNLNELMHIVIPNEVEESLDSMLNEFALVQSKN